MQRRSFLGSILALATAPAIVRPESLMKIAPRQIWVPPAGIFTQAMAQGPRISLFTKGGILLAEIPLQAKINDHGATTMLRGAGSVFATGKADHVEIDLPGGLRHKAQVGHGGLQLDNEHLCLGQTLNIDGLRFT